MAIAALGSVLSVVGTVVGVVGQMKQAAASKEAEKAREKQVTMQAQREQREQLRKAQVARASALANATNQGAGADSSALQGGYGQIAGTANRNIGAIQSDLTLSKEVFKANQQYADAGMITALGGGLSSLAGAFTSNTGTITRVGASAGFSGFGKPRAAY